MKKRTYSKCVTGINKAKTKKEAIAADLSSVFAQDSSHLKGVIK